jgi:hypothetical protein
MHKGQQIAQNPASAATTPLTFSVFCHMLISTLFSLSNLLYALTPSL